MFFCSLCTKLAFNNFLLPISVVSHNSENSTKLNTRLHYIIHSENQIIIE